MLIKEDQSGRRKGDDEHDGDDNLTKVMTSIYIRCSGLQGFLHTLYGS